MKDQLRQFILRALLAAEGAPLSDDTLRAAMRSGFAVAMTNADLGEHIRWTEQHGYIAGTNDDLLGTLWVLTPLGKIRALKLQ